MQLVLSVAVILVDLSVAIMQLEVSAALMLVTFFVANMLVCRWYFLQCIMPMTVYCNYTGNCFCYSCLGDSFK